MAAAGDNIGGDGVPLQGLAQGGGLFGEGRHLLLARAPVSLDMSIIDMKSGKSSEAMDASRQLFSDLGDRRAGTSQAGIEVDPQAYILGRLIQFGAPNIQATFGIDHACQLRLREIAPAGYNAAN